MSSGEDRLVERFGLERPIFQAPMAHIARAELAGAVSKSGALGSVGMLPSGDLVEQIGRAKEIAGGRSVASGLLLPFTLRRHVEALVAARPAACILMDGTRPEVTARLREAGICVIHQVGSVAQAMRALRDGADVLVAQGVEAGGHVLGTERGEVLLPRVLEIAKATPVLASGGIAEAADVRSALERGASGVLVGTRFLETEEAVAHRAYKARVLGATTTVVTRLFGIGWSQRHRVVPNEATRRFCDEQGDVPAWVIALQRAMEPLARHVAFTRLQRLGRARTSARFPLLAPASLHPGQDAAGVEYAPLYAGECARRIHAIEPAADVVRALSR